MGYGYYTLPDGRKAGYAVEARCDNPGCGEVIDRGLSYLCGLHPEGYRDVDEPGCGGYFCMTHLYELPGHDCPHPPCHEWGDGKEMPCTLVRDHDDDHYSEHKNRYFPRKLYAAGNQ